MTSELALLGILALAVIGLAWWAARMARQLRRIEEQPRTLELLQREVQAVRSGLDDRLREQAQQAHELSLRIGRLQKATENVEQLGVGLNELQKILRPPQLRGGFGERQLEELLADTLPRSGFEVQYTYPSNGVRVDAAVFLGHGRLLPIDSKFPLDNFRRWVELRGAGDTRADSARRAFARDVMGHIDDIAARYLAPDDGAVDVAFMYIPSESVFHEISVADFVTNGCTLAEYAQRARVVPASPNTL
ncbi:MAG: DNA recombination protein RmuC, partial [Gammaproteobacteria bacterium]|nr:DNA recombination protein RmuC [Gammaproteobacteria bacterium]NIU03704.1 DNA recombination protein RmuC [Gammaproteobacteria bacterium]NIV53215.1 DNA recombination protein RmuC [Gammaproteobacteria bacterium]NIX84978.1 DNA recombination protein RmuC [Gammaproteobacteria bacterium]